MGEHGRQDGGQPGQVEPVQETLGGLAGPGGRGLVAGEDPRHGQGDGQADRHVDQEHRPPLRTEQVRGHQHAAHHLAGDGAAGQHGRVGAQRPGPGRALEALLDHAHDLRDHRRRARPLDQPGADQESERRGQPAGQRGRGEGEHPGEEHPPPAEDVPQPGPGDQQRGVADGVPRHHELQAGAGPVQGPADGGQGDVDDRDIEQAHELPGQQQAEHDPGAAGRPGHRRDRPVVQRGRHDSSLARPAANWREAADAGTRTTSHGPRHDPRHDPCHRQTALAGRFLLLSAAAHADGLWMRRYPHPAVGNGASIKWRPTASCCYQVGASRGGCGRRRPRPG